MNLIDIIGMLAAIFTTIANVPQAVKVIKTRSTKSLSVVTYSMLFLGLTLWFVYGIIKKDIPIIFANAIAAMLCGIILFMKIIAILRKEEKE
ncbi:hypothetical protein GCM10007424_15380 [Flavobacterium suaedae]|uniref:Glutathione synthetase n=1 Tax=Flavobacterium suaedae TaxID=1767027 RepID=A0ABQ1JTC9_9FLAO|nr:SemiSWEET transporter [Flavobacterium suaedae]GGB76297.1 hypothetical protein GCM10007424_15380 [Flavobacterium suaedae]